MESAHFHNRTSKSSESGVKGVASLDPFSVRKNSNPLALGNSRGHFWWGMS